jgi:hypothetical protein
MVIGQIRSILVEQLTFRKSIVQLITNHQLPTMDVTIFGVVDQQWDPITQTGYRIEKKLGSTQRIKLASRDVILNEFRADLIIELENVCGEEMDYFVLMVDFSINCCMMFSD